MIAPAEWWAPVAAAPQYQVSNMGRVRRAVPARGAQAGKVLTPCAGSGKAAGYQYVCLCVGGVKSWHLIHRLVAEAFLGPSPKEGAEVDHANGIRSDNRVGNLEWVTRRENMRRMVARRRAEANRVLAEADPARKVLPSWAAA